MGKATKTADGRKSHRHGTCPRGAGKLETTDTYTHLLLVTAANMHQVVHQFSHVHYHCHCWHIKLSGDDGVIKGNPLLDIEHSRNTNWIDKSLLTQQPISTLVKKV